MKLNKVFQTASVPIPDRSGFDLSREHLFTAPVGTLVPAECFEVLPNDTVSVGGMMKVTLPPFAVPFMGRIDACMEAFFIPNRILWKGWNSFITQNAGDQLDASHGTPNTGAIPLQVPVIDLGDQNNQTMLGTGTLADYLGYGQVAQPSGGYQFISALKFLAYHKVVDHWYRDQNNMKPFFIKNPTIPFVASNQGQNSGLVPHYIDSIGTAQATMYLGLLPYSTTLGGYDSQYDTSIGLGSLRQRCWAKDYFTTATTRPQAGDAAQITFATNAATGSITVADIRAASALQRWLERNNISGTDYGSQILAHFGVTPPDAIMDKPILLGSVREPVYVGSVENNSNAVGNNNTDNPFGATLGSAAGFGSSYGKGSLVPEFHAKEHGFIMIMFSLVPHAYYNTGCERELMHKGIGDFAWPEYAHIGDQPIYVAELLPSSSQSSIFGYNQRYSEYKFRPDKVSGLLRDTSSLEVYALQRGFSAAPQLSKSFLTIPTDYLDQVSQTNYEVSKFGCIVDSFFDTRAIRLLPEYSLPKI